MSNRSLTRSMKSHHANDYFTAYAMLAPVVILLTIFVIIPLIYSFRVSFTDWSFYGVSKFVGFDNYILNFTDETFIGSLLVAGKYVLFVVPLEFIICFLFAHVLRAMRGKAASFAKTAIYVPTVVSGVVAATIFMFIFAYDGGLLNAFLRIFGIENQAFLVDPIISTLCVSVPVIWLFFGYNTLIMLAGLLDIPVTYYEAADVEGASAFRKLIHITVPSMKNIFVLVCITLVTATIQLFDVPYVMTVGGQPVNANLTPIIKIYNDFKLKPTMGPTVSASLLMIFVIGSVNGFIFKIVGSEKAMDA